MRIKNLVFILLFFLTPGISAQNQPVYNDTSYFIPYDEDFNLIISASKGHLLNVQNLLERGADINAVTVDGISALMYAAENGDIEMVKLLLKESADPNMKPFNGITALISTARTNQMEIAELLINNGAKINASDEEGVTSIHYAAAYNYPELVKMLLFYGADPKITDNDGTPPIITTAYNNSFESLKILIEKDLNINTRDKLGYTPLMVAIQEGNLKIANYLLDNGADINIANNGNMTALAFAIMEGDYEMTEKLIDRGANVSHRISGSINMLSLAMDNGEEEITDLLLANDARQSYYPSFNEITIGPGLQFNSNDFFTSIKLSVQDSRYNTGINTGFHFRPAAIRILTDPLNDTLFQYWERRYFFDLGIEKRFALINNSLLNSESGPFFGLGAAYSFGAYRGSSSVPEASFLFNPRAGWYVKNNWLFLKLNYEYLNFNISNLSPHRFSLSFNFTIPLISNKMREKEIDWLQYE